MMNAILKLITNPVARLEKYEAEQAAAEIVFKTAQASYADALLGDDQKVIDSAQKAVKAATEKLDDAAYAVEVAKHALQEAMRRDEETSRKNTAEGLRRVLADREKDAEKFASLAKQLGQAWDALFSSTVTAAVIARGLGVDAVSAGCSSADMQGAARITMAQSGLDFVYSHPFLSDLPGIDRRVAGGTTVMVDELKSQGI